MGSYAQSVLQSQRKRVRKMSNMGFTDGKVHTAPRVYLAGGMEHAEGWGQGWREEFTPWLKELGYEPYNPMEAQKEHSSMEELAELKATSIRKYQAAMSGIIEADLNQLSQCRVVVCYLDDSVLKGAGTYGELTYCKANGIPVFACIDLPKGAEDLPGWCLGCITDFEESVPMFKYMMGSYDAEYITDKQMWKRIEEANKLLT
jgi:nucleoside 2-deoxyribosyltransferase